MVKLCKFYVVVDIGCLECHNPSKLIRVSTNRDEALATGATPVEDLSTEDMDTDSWSAGPNGGPLRVMFVAEGAVL